MNDSINKTSSIVSSLFLGWAGIFMFLILPLFVGTVSAELALTDEQIGYLAASDLFGFFLGSLSSIWWSKRSNWRIMGALALVLIILCDSLSMILTPSFSIFLIIRVLSGIGQGAAISIYSAHIGYTTQPERHYANFLIGQTVLGAIGLFLLPRWMANTTIGSNAILWTHIALSVFALVGVFTFLPTKGLDRTSALRHFSLSKWRVPMLGLLALLLFFIAQGGTWAYMERIGKSFNLSTDFVGFSLSLAMIGAFFGSSTASLLLATKWGRRIPLLIVGIGQPLCLLLIFSGLGNFSFSIGIILFLFLWNLAIPYLMGILIGIDSSGVAILAANPTFALGASIAPIIIAPFVGGVEYSSVGWVGAVAMLGSIGLFLSLIRFIQK